MSSAKGISKAFSLTVNVAADGSATVNVQTNLVPTHDDIILIAKGLNKDIGMEQVSQIMRLAEDQEWFNRPYPFSAPPDVEKISLSAIADNVAWLYEYRVGLIVKAIGWTSELAAVIPNSLCGEQPAA